MTSYDKVVRLACKPKAAPPKSKYLDPIIAATWSEDGAVHDVCKALSPRFREPNAIVVFKALIVLHTMIRNGSTDNVLSCLSSTDVLRLGNVSAGNWEGYNAPQNMQNYAIYLDSRISAYRDLKHDAIRVQAESNRDLRNSQSIANSTDDDSYRGRNSGPKSTSSSGPTRSKTIMGRKLRVMTVEKGLLRETKAVHGMIDALVECRFYLDDLEDELTTTALRMLVKDLLILFQAGNEGVINLLEHYFEMSHIDAEQALRIYRNFCKQTERVVEYLGVAKKLQNILQVSIPNLKHAPVSLAGALQEYLDDPNFEQNRIEYKTNKEAAERSSSKPGLSSKTVKKATSSAAPPVPSLSVSSASSPTTSKPAESKPAGNTQAVVDFFTAIEEEQSTMFNPSTNSPNQAYFQQQAASNPFAQRQMMTGQPFAVPSGQMHPQQTGFIVPQQTAFQNPFGLQPQQTGHRPFSSFLQPQATGFPTSQSGPFGQPQNQGFLQPQATGVNPFRQSMLMPQSTGMALFAGGGQGAPGPFQSQVTGQPSPFQSQPTGQPGLFQNQAMGQPGPFQSQATGQPGPFQVQSTGQPGQGAMQSFGSQSSPVSAQPSFAPQPSFAAPFAQSPSSASTNTSGFPPRPASAPLSALGNTQASPPAAQPVKTHQTGTKNPFGRVATPPPAVPRQPTLMELAMGGSTGGFQSGANGNFGQQNQAHQQSQSQGQPNQLQTQQTGSLGGFGFNSGALGAGSTDISSIASSFAFSKNNGNANKPTSPGASSNALNPQDTASTATGSTFSDMLSTLSFQPTGMTATSTTSSPPPTTSPSLVPQTTGFGGLKAFKPSSSFGASLLESLPPIPGSNPGTPSIAPSNPTLGATSSTPSSSGPSPQMTGFSGANPQFNGNGIYSGVGSTLRPQMTGGAANPFRASMAPPMGDGAPKFSGLPAFSPTQFGSTPSFGANLFGSSGSFSLGAGQQQQQQQQQPHQNGASLI